LYPALDVLLLFLDTETTGLKPISDQIIEIGGLIVDFDPISLHFKEISSFESTIQLRKQLDEKITRLTGITTEELSTASGLFQVQEKWLSWLEPYEAQIQGIIGHSVDFDLGFLRQENWFLPKTKIIDTLDLARIIFPDLEAINLEFLVNSLNINFESSSSHHRSLFDTTATFHLFKIVINRLQALKLPKKYLDLIVSNFLDLKIDFYASSEPTISFSRDYLEQQTIIYLGLNGKMLTPPTETRLEKLTNITVLENIASLLEFKHTKKITILLLQIGTIFYLKNLWPTKSYKIHLQRGLQDYWLLDFILEYLEKEIVISGNPAVIPRMESLIWNIHLISQKHLELGKIVEFMETLSFYNPGKNNEEPGSSSLSGLDFVTHDFLLAAVGPFSNYGKYEYNPATCSLQENILIEKLTNIIVEINILKDNLLTDSGQVNELFESEKTRFYDQLKAKILDLIADFDWQKYQNLQVNTFNNLITLSVEKSDFLLNGHFLDLKKLYPDLAFQSYLPPELLSRMKAILNLDLPIESLSDDTDFEFFDKIDLASFLEEKLFLATEANKPVVVLGGINSTLKELKNQALNGDKADKYVILGENGSTTKIISKIINGFSGVVICKINNLEQFLKTLDSSKFAEVVLVNQPYFFVDQYWKNVYKLLGFDKYSGEKELKYLYLKSLQYYYYNVYGVFLNFVRGY